MWWLQKTHPQAKNLIYGVSEGEGHPIANMAEAWELHRRDEAGHLPGRPRWLHQHRHSQSDYDLYKRNQSRNDTQQQA